MNRPFLLSGILGLLAVLLALRIPFPLSDFEFGSPRPFTKPIIALEFAASQETMAVLLGSDNRADKITALQHSTDRDTLFVFGYTLFLAAIAATVWRQTRQKRFLGLGLLALAIGLFDFFENGAIKMLLFECESGFPAPDSMAYSRVRAFAWAKWLSIALYFAALAPYFWSRGWLLGRSLSLVGGVAATLCVAAWFSPAWTELFVSTVFLAFPLAVVFCFLEKNNADV